MRFSSIFQSSPSSRVPRAKAPERAEDPVAAIVPAAAAVPALKLPDDLDQRVRLIGEWQLGEG